MDVIINFKTYARGTGERAVALARLCERVARRFPVMVWLAPQMADLSAVATVTKLPVLAQHVDAVPFGPHTGSVLVESVKAAGAKGSFVNHSEHRLSRTLVGQTIPRIHDNRLLAVLCLQNAAEVARYARLATKLRPDVIAVEPPELIGGKISVSTAHPRIIQRAVASARGIPVLVGAGIHTTEDVRTALRFGAQGVLVSSDILLAKNPQRELVGLLRGFV